MINYKIKQYYTKYKTSLEIKSKMNLDHYWQKRQYVEMTKRYIDIIPGLYCIKLSLFNMMQGWSLIQRMLQIVHLTIKSSWTLMKIKYTTSSSKSEKIILKTRFNKLKIFDKETLTNLLKFAKIKEGSEIKRTPWFPRKNMLYRRN